MSEPAARETLATPAGEVPLHDYRLGLLGREWSVLHTEAVLSYADEAAFLATQKDRVPYGVVLWPAAIALAHEVAARADAMPGARVLELGAGTGLPGIVAASLGARVTQTDRHALALAVCRRNGLRNGVASVEYRQDDWTAWTDDGPYDLVLGSDVLYGRTTHDALRDVLRRTLAPTGRALVSDPFRAASLPFLERLEADGWGIALAKWRVGEDEDPRPIGVYELVPPRDEKLGRG